MKPIRWTPHALQNLIDREIDRAEAESTLNDPEFSIPRAPDRRVLMRRYLDPVLNQEMLMRVVLEETAEEIVVVTIYKTSQIERYTKGLAP